MSTLNGPLTTQNPKTSNLNMAHDLTYLIVYFLLGTNTTIREDNLTIVNNINCCLKENGALDRLAVIVVKVKWNHQSNYLMSGLTSEKDFSLGALSQTSFGKQVNSVL